MSLKPLDLKNQTLVTVKADVCDGDGQSDGYGGYEFKEVVTSIELDTEYLYTYY